MSRSVSARMATGRSRVPWLRPNQTMIDNSSIDRTRRYWITVTSVTGGIGLAATAVPFVESFAPSERARVLGAPVEASLRSAEPGVLRTVEWQGKPIFVLERTSSMLGALSGHDDLLADPASRRSLQPDYAKNTTRSIKPEVLVLIGLCTHLGCIPTFRPTPGAPDLGAAWPGGFFAHATARSSTWPGASSRTCRHRPTCSCRPITSHRVPR